MILATHAGRREDVVAVSSALEPRGVHATIK